MQFGDLNNDGTLDLYLVNGYVSADRNKNYWYDFSKIAGGNSCYNFRCRQLAGDGRSQFVGLPAKARLAERWRRKFVNVAQAVGASDNYDGRSVALVDLWNRGVLDVVVANQRGPLLIYKNTASPENQWIDFELEGTASNRSAIGAEVTAILEWQTAGPAGFRWQRVLCPKSATAAFRNRKESAT